MAVAETENAMQSNGGDEEGEADVITKSCVLGAFGESDETRNLISSLPEVHGSTTTTEAATERFLRETFIH